MSGLPRRIAVLGSSGYLGRQVVAALLGRSDVDLVLGVGRTAASGLPSPPHPRFTFVPADLARIPLDRAFRDHGIEAFVHLVFSSRPVHNLPRAYLDDVAATAMVFSAASRVGVRYGLLVSSIAVYGPGSAAMLLDESVAPRPNCFQFAAHKVLQEIAAVRQAKYSGMRLGIARPCTVVGPGATNFLLDCLRGPLAALPSGCTPRWQFLHADDFCNAVLAMLSERAVGVFNLAPDDSIELEEAMRLLGARPVVIPRRLLLAATWLGWRLRVRAIAPAPPEAVDFLVAPPLVSNRRMVAELGVPPRYRSREAIASVRQTPEPRALNAAREVL